MINREIMKYPRYLQYKIPKVGELYKNSKGINQHYNTINFNLQVLKKFMFNTRIRFVLSKFLFPFKT